MSLYCTTGALKGSKLLVVFHIYIRVGFGPGQYELQVVTERLQKIRRPVSNSVTIREMYWTGPPLERCYIFNGDSILLFF